MEHVLHGSEKLTESVSLARCNSPYILRRDQKLPNSGHDIFHVTDMDAFCVFAQKKMKRAGL